MDRTFIQTIKNTFGIDGEAWLSALPGLIDEASRRWNLTDIWPVPNLSYNFVAFAKSSSPLAPLPKGEGNLVIKLGVPNRELTGEIAALCHFDGRGAVRLLDADAEKGMLLLERLRKRFDGETGPLPKYLVETAEALSRDLLAENKDEVLLHGDFHHFNVLESARGWLAIDPKGVVGPRGYEMGPLLINPIDRFLSGSNPKAQTEKRIAVLSERLGMERERIRSWAICHSVLSAWWSIEDKEPGGGEYSLRCAEIFIGV